jgi:hypothetical protein
VIRDPCRSLELRVLGRGVDDERSKAAPHVTVFLEEEPTNFFTLLCPCGNTSRCPSPADHRGRARQSLRAVLLFAMSGAHGVTRPTLRCVARWNNHRLVAQSNLEGRVTRVPDLLSRDCGRKWGLAELVPPTNQLDLDLGNRPYRCASLIVANNSGYGGAATTSSKRDSMIIPYSPQLLN